MRRVVVISRLTCVAKHELDNFSGYALLITVIIHFSSFFLNLVVVTLLIYKIS